MCIGISALRSLHFSSITLVLSLSLKWLFCFSRKDYLHKDLEPTKFNSRLLHISYEYQSNKRVSLGGGKKREFWNFWAVFCKRAFCYFFREDINKRKIGALPTVRAVQLSKKTRDILNFELSTNQSARKFLVKTLMDKIYCCLERIPFPLERNLFGTSARNRSQRPSLWPAPSACEHSRARDYAQTEPFLLRGDRAFQINLRSVTGIGSGFPAAAYPWAHFKS